MSVVPTILYCTRSNRLLAGAKLLGASRCAAKHGFAVQTVEEFDRDRTPPANLVEFWHPQGVIADCSGRSNLFHRADFRGIPVVHLDCPPPRRTAEGFRVFSDSNLIGQLAARELLMLDYPHFAFVGYPEPRFWSGERRHAFAASLAMNGRRLTAAADFDFDQDVTIAHRRLRDWLAKLPRPCAIYAANDRMAEQVTIAARTISARIPEDFALIGTDNEVERCENAVPPISSIGLDFEHAGYLAMELMVQRIRKPHAKSASRTFGCSLFVHRESSRLLRRQHPKIAMVLKLIREQATTGLRAAEALDILGGSRRLAELRFKEAVGHSVMDEILAVRTQRAMILLADPARQINEISGLCGYLSPNAFRRIFKSETGLTPRAWRKAKFPTC